MKKAPFVEEAELGAGESILDPLHRSYRVVCFSRVEYGSKCAEFTVEVAGVGAFELDAFAPSSKPVFVQPRSIRDKYTGGFRRTFTLDADLLYEILGDVVARLVADQVE